MEPGVQLPRPVLGGGRRQPALQSIAHHRRGAPVGAVSWRCPIELGQPVAEGVGELGSTLGAPVRQPPRRARQPVDEPLGRLQLRPAAHEPISDAEYRTRSLTHDHESASRHRRSALTRDLGVGLTAAG